MEKIEQNEQWKLHGDCQTCRRKNYCSKPCAANARRTKAKLNSMVYQAIDKATGGAISTTLDILSKR